MKSQIPSCNQSSTHRDSDQSNATNSALYSEVKKHKENSIAVMEPLHSSPSPELFELLCKLQSSRLDDQRCSLPGTVGNPATQQSVKSSPSKAILQETLKHPPPYPSIVVPPNGGYWIETPGSAFHNADVDIHVDDSARAYRAHFLGYEHYNFYGTDEQQGSVLVSLKYYKEEDDNEKCARVIVRLTSGTLHQLVYESQVGDVFTPLKVAKFLVPDLNISQLYPVVCPQTSDLVAEYDEHSLVTTFKFGLIYQKFGQINEESLFGNRTHSPAMEEFMHLLGQVVPLSTHQGYRGGLDTKHGQTGEFALYETFRGREIIFHVSTLLPYVENDPQQLQRKCHIGNDILSIVFQDTNTPFCPDMIASHFLHAYIIVQAIDPCTSNTRYKVSVTSRDDVPFFGPSLPSPAIFSKGKQLKEFLLSKLINGERACYKATKFYALHQRTRATLLENVTQELRLRTEDYMSSGMGSKQQLQTSSKLITKLTRKALGTKSKSQSQFQQPPPSIPTSTPRCAPNPASSNTVSASNPIRKCSSNAVLSVSSSVDSTSMGSTLTTSTRSDGTGNKGIKTSIIIGGHSTADSGHGDSDHSLTSSPHLEGRDSETDDNSDSIDSIMDDSLGRNQMIPQRHRKVAKNTRQNRVKREASVVRLTSNHALVPECRNVISGAVTTIHVEGNNSSVESQISKLQDEIFRLRVDKLELLRQIFSVQHEVRRLQDRETQLQSDLNLAGGEIRRLKTIKTDS